MASKKYLHPADASDDDSEGDTSASTAKKKISPIDVRGKSVVFTGALTGCTRKQAELKAMQYGCIPRGMVSKNTDIVVVGASAGIKADKAEDLGIKTMTQDDWEQLLAQSKPIRASAKRDHDSDLDDDYQPKAKKRTPKKKPALVHAISLTDDEADTPYLKVKPSTSKKTHCVSDSDTDTDVADSKLAISKKRKKGNSDTESEDEEDKTVSKKAKLEENNPKAGGSKIKCMYWEKCYRKDPYHLAQYRHPAATVGTRGVLTRRASEVCESQGKGGSGDGDSPPKPKNKMDDGESVEFGSGIGKYRIKRTGDHYYCTCMAWKNQKAAVDSRTCKHLKQYLGEEFEQHRVGDQGTSGEKTISRAPRHKNIPQLLLAHKYSEGQEYKGWWISEKLDGVRAYWDGKAFYSRLGNEFIPPPWFVKGFPSDMELDGELFGGRGKFQSTVSIVKTPGSAKWKELTYEVFDCPHLGNQGFEKRVEALDKLFSENSVPYAHMVEHARCKGKTHLEEELERVEDLGGEGLMIREPRSKYVNGRSQTLLKIKTFHDAEARVIGHEGGKGKNTNRCGALRCVMECGKKFNVGSGLSDKDRLHPPKIGTIIVYKFQELTNSGVPRFPSYIGVAIDKTKPKDAVLKKKPE